VPVPPRPHAAAPTGARQRSTPTPQAPADEDNWPVDRGRPLGLRLLALVGALSFLMLGLSVVAPLLQPRPQAPPPAEGRGRTA
jgi:hypothetical protein